MKIKCNNCRKELDISVDKIDICSYKNYITLQDELSINVYHQTFCKECGELV